MMNQPKKEIILNELLNKSKGVKDGVFTPDICEIPLSEIENYDFFIFNELQNIERELWNRNGTYFNNEIKKVAPILKITNDDKILFIPRIVSDYLKEIKNE